MVYMKNRFISCYIFYIKKLHLESEISLNFRSFTLRVLLPGIFDETRDWGIWSSGSGAACNKLPVGEGLSGRLTQARYGGTCAIPLCLWQNGSLEMIFCLFESAGWHHQSGFFHGRKCKGKSAGFFFRCIIRFTRFKWIQTGFSGSGNYLFLFLKWSPEWDFQNWEWAVFLPISVFSRIFLSEIVSEIILWIHNFDFPIYRYNRKKSILKSNYDDLPYSWVS